jgi:hypothetical protein
MTRIFRAAGLCRRETKHHDHVEEASREGLALLESWQRIAPDVQVVADATVTAVNSSCRAILSYR